MSCSCNKKVARNADGEAFPLISTQYGLTHPQESDCCGPADSCPSPGSAIPAYLTDSCCENSGVTLLARKGNKLTRFTGSGFLEFIKGKATLVEVLSLKIKELYHRRFKTLGKGLPVVGEPLDSAYDVIADSDGKLFAQRGTSTEDSVKMWDSTLELHTVKPVSELPKTHKGLLPYETTLELVGFVPIPSSGDATDVRSLSVLSGEGIIVFTKQATIDSDCVCEGCQPVEAEASVASFLPNPTEDGNYVLKFNNIEGHYWELE